MTTASRFSLRRFHILFLCVSSQIPDAISNIPVQSTKVQECYSLKGVHHKSYLRLTYTQRTPAYSITKHFMCKLSADSCAMFVLLWMWKWLKVVNGLLVHVCGTNRTMCTKFCNKRTTFNKITVKTKYTDGPKFADPSMAAISPYFKRSMALCYESAQRDVK